MPPFSRIQDAAASQRLRFRDFPRVIVPLAIVCMLVGAVIALVNGLTEPMVQKNREARSAAAADLFAWETAIRNLVPDITSVKRAGEWRIHGQAAPYFSFSRPHASGGYAILSYGVGYSGLISVLVAVDAQGSVLNIAVREQTETPGLGDQVLDASFTAQFAGKRAEQLIISNTGDEGLIQGIAGATVSCRAVAEDAVRAAVEFLQKEALH